MLVGKLLEVGAAVELLDDGVCLFLRLHEDVTGVHLIGGRRVGDFLVVAGADLGIGNLVDDALLDHFAMQRALLQEGHAALEVGILVEAGGHRLSRHYADFDRRRQRRGAALLGRKLRELLRQLALGKPKVCLGQRLAVDGGDHGVRIDRLGRRSGCCRLGRGGFLRHQRRQREGR